MKNILAAFFMSLLFLCCDPVRHGEYIEVQSVYVTLDHIEVCDNYNVFYWKPIGEKGYSYIEIKPLHTFLDKGTMECIKLRR